MQGLRGVLELHSDELLLLLVGKEELVLRLLPLQTVLALEKNNERSLVNA